SQVMTCSCRAATIRLGSGRPGVPGRRTVAVVTWAAAWPAGRADSQVGLVDSSTDLCLEDAAGGATRRRGRQARLGGAWPPAAPVTDGSPPSRGTPDPSGGLPGRPDPVQPDPAIPADRATARRLALSCGR